ncbi:hypothetical protein ACFXP7_04480 [Microbacterium sp. P06]|uniref:hypothetical protein n=1 Tax=Microbacterium sp. P06 TaxID=3366949 RepID=UPI00374576BC
MNTIGDAAVLERFVAQVTDTIGHTAVAGVDLSGLQRPRAARSRLQHAMTRLAFTLYADRAPRALMLVWTGQEPATAAVRTLTLATGESLHRHSEMVRGCPLGLSLVFADAHTPAEILAVHLTSPGSLMVDGVAAVSWIDACGCGIRQAAAAARI